MSRPTIVLYYDLISPFAYFAFVVVRTSAVFKDVDVKYVPVYLNGILKACENPTPLNIKNKTLYMLKEQVRWAKLFDVPKAETLPPGFPYNTVYVQRALVAVTLIKPEKLEEITAKLYSMHFAELQHVHKPEVFGKVLVEILGDCTAKEVMEKAGSEEAKKLLNANAEKVLGEGGFGLPWFEVTNAKGDKECFWGFGHLGQVAHHLGLERPRTGGSNESGWRAML